MQTTKRDTRGTISKNDKQPSRSKSSFSFRTPKATLWSRTPTVRNKSRAEPQKPSIGLATIDLQQFANNPNSEHKTELSDAELIELLEESGAARLSRIDSITNNALLFEVLQRPSICRQLTNLQRIHCSRCDWSSSSVTSTEDKNDMALERIRMFPKLTHLHLEKCNLSQSNFLCHTFPSLEWLSLTNNRLRYLPLNVPTKAFPRLRHLDVSYNNFRTLSDLSLSSWSRACALLEEFDIFGNDIAYPLSDPTGDVALLSAFPSLLQINGRPTAVQTAKSNGSSQSALADVTPVSRQSSAGLPQNSEPNPSGVLSPAAQNLAASSIDFGGIEEAFFYSFGASVASKPNTSSASNHAMSLSTITPVTPLVHSVSTLEGRAPNSQTAQPQAETLTVEQGTNFRAKTNTAPSVSRLNCPMNAPDQNDAQACVEVKGKVMRVHEEKLTKPLRTTNRLQRHAASQEQSDSHFGSSCSEDSVAAFSRLVEAASHHTPSIPERRPFVDKTPVSNLNRESLISGKAVDISPELIQSGRKRPSKREMFVSPPPLALSEPANPQRGRQPTSSLSPSVATVEFDSKITTSLAVEKPPSNSDPIPQQLHSSELHSSVELMSLQKPLTIREQCSPQGHARRSFMEAAERISGPSSPLLPGTLLNLPLPPIDAPTPERRQLKDRPAVTVSSRDKSTTGPVSVLISSSSLPQKVPIGPMLTASTLSSDGEAGQAATPPFDRYGSSDAGSVVGSISVMSSGSSFVAELWQISLRVEKARTAYVNCLKAMAPTNHLALAITNRLVERDAVLRNMLGTMEFASLAAPSSQRGSWELTKSLLRMISVCFAGFCIGPEKAKSVVVLLNVCRATMFCDASSFGLPSNLIQVLLKIEHSLANIENELLESLRNSANGSSELVQVFFRLRFLLFGLAGSFAQTHPLTRSVWIEA